tara:strand:- start:11235 stop:11978 length:744 start_codon:yes stop_codon:yes gene_type:complete
MSVSRNNLVIYTSVNMPEDNTSLTGGAINSGIRASFDDPSSSSKIVIYSASASDTSQNLSIRGRTDNGIIVNETLNLSGTTQVISNYTYNRILKTHLNSGCWGIITVSGQSVNNIAEIPVGESGFSRPFYDATAYPNTAKTYYEKIFVKNNNNNTALSDAYVVQSNAGLYNKVQFALEDTKQADQTITNRETVPTGITGGFGSGISGIINNKLLALDYQGVWLKLSLDAEESAINSFYEIQVSGTTV